MVDYNYSERISHNEQRIAELKGKIYVAKKSVIALEKENKRCIEAMNNCTSPIDTDKTKKDKQILDLTATVEKLKNDNKKLKKEKKELKVALAYTEDRLNRKIDKLQHKLRNDVILSPNFHDSNIFMEVRSETDGN